MLALSCCDAGRKRGWCGREACEREVRCMECGWTGQQRECVHDYEDDGTGMDVVAIDLCPACGAREPEEVASC